MKTTLLKGIRIVERADTNSMRSVMFAHYAKGKLGVRLVLRGHQLIRGSWLSTWMVAAYGMKSFLTLGPPARGADLLALARFANARHQLETVAACIGMDRVSWARFDKWLLLSVASHVDLFRQLRQPRAFRRYLRCVVRLSRKHDFFVSCRLTSTIALYARSLQLLAAGSAKAVLVSSDYNPEEVALTRAGARQGVRSIFVAHAHTNRLSPPLDLDLAILDGEAALDVYRRKGPVTAKTVYRGVEGPSRAMATERLATPSPVIGLFLPSQIRWETLRDVMIGCRQRLSPRAFRIRLHPNMLESHQLDSLTERRDDIDISPKGTPLVSDALRCDFVIADESSNVHLTVLKTGVPTVAIAGLGVHPPDMEDHYGFITNGIIPPLVPSVNDLALNTIAAFYRHGWEDRFRYYDARYMRPQVETDQNIRRAVLEVASLGD